MEDDRPRLEEDVSTSTEDTQHLERRRRLKVAAVFYRARGSVSDPNWFSADRDPGVLMTKNLKGSAEKKLLIFLRNCNLVIP